MKLQLSQLVQEPSPSLICPICQDIFLEPSITSSCFHSFCKQCIKTSLQSDSSCPLCRKRLKWPNDVHLNLALAQLIAELLVFCPFKQDGCPEVIRFDTVQTHVNSTCLFVRKKCVYEKYGCEFVGVETTLSSHINICPYYNLRFFLFNTEKRLQYLENIVMEQQNVINALKKKDDSIRSSSASPVRSDVESAENLDLTVAQHNWIQSGMACTKTIVCERSGVTSLAYHSTGNLFAGAYDGSIKIFDSSGSLKTTLTGHQLSVWSMAIDDSQQRLFAGSSDETVTVWDTGPVDAEGISGQPIAVFPSKHGKVYSLVLKSGLIFAASSDGTVNIWNSRTLDHVGTLKEHLSGVNSIKVFGDNLYSASSDKTIKIWDVTTMKCIQTIPSQSSEILDLTVGSNLVFASGYDSRISAFNLNDYSRVADLLGHKWEVWQLEYSSNVLFSGSHDHSLKIWDLRNFSNAATLTGHQGYIHALIWAESGLLSASLDRQIKFWR